MNRVLDYRGYRFSQASYDEDERGTVLLVSRDWLGTYLAYPGYFLLTVSIFFTFFTRGAPVFTVFGKGFQKTICSWPAFWRFRRQERAIVSRKRASEYGWLVVQDLDGRMKPWAISLPTEGR